MQLQFSQVGSVVAFKDLNLAMSASQAIRLPQGHLGFFLVLKAQESDENIDLTFITRDDLLNALFVIWDGESTLSKADNIFIPVNDTTKLITWNPSELAIGVTDGVVSNVECVDIVHFENFITFQTLA